MSPKIADVLVREVMPIIQGTVPQTVKPIGAEDHEELVQDCITMAAMMLDALERAGKRPIPRSVAYYAIQRIKSGRRSYSAGRTDVMSAGARLDGRVVMVACEQSASADGDGVELTIGDMLASNVEDPSTTALRRIDWCEFEALLSSRESTVLHGLVIGSGTGELARQCGVSAPRITQIKGDLADEIKACWGEDVLQEVDRKPLWRSSLRARELTAA